MAILRHFLLRPHLPAAIRKPLIANHGALEQDFTIVIGFKEVYAAKKGGFARSTRADDRYDLARLNV